MDALALIAEGACYPNGLTSTSILGPPVSYQDPTNPSGPPLTKSNAIDIAQGWPMADDVDAAMAAGRSLVTVYPVPGTTSVLPTPFDFNPQPVAAPAYGMACDGSADGFTLWGAPNVGEYTTVLIDLGYAYSYAAEAGDLPGTVMAFLANAIAQNYPGSTFNGTSVQIVGAKSLEVRIGAPAMVGQVIGRQRQMFRTIVWSSNPADRATIGRAINVALRQNLRITFPDTSQGFINFARDDLTDERQNVNIYRRDLIAFVQWDTLDLIPACEVTAVTLDFEPPQGALQRAR